MTLKWILYKSFKLSKVNTNGCTINAYTKFFFLNHDFRSSGIISGGEPQKMRTYVQIQGWFLQYQEE